MTAKSRDKNGRWRSRTVAFRLSDAESDELNMMVALSGLAKQDYILNKLLNKDVVVKGNPRVFKALKGALSEVHSELLRIGTEITLSEELLETIRIVSKILGDMTKEDKNNEH